MYSSAFDKVKYSEMPDVNTGLNDNEFYSFMDAFHELPPERLGLGLIRSRKIVGQYMLDGEVRPKDQGAGVCFDFREDVDSVIQAIGNLHFGTVIIYHEHPPMQAKKEAVDNINVLLSPEDQKFLISVKKRFPHIDFYAIVRYKGNDFAYHVTDNAKTWIDSEEVPALNKRDLFTEMRLTGFEPCRINS